ncbi:MAG TPA: hypothetical protein VJU78_07840 [Chitinophagaceae bacterium]|nr:hypothetical protein [Chitinophagaceae bacterium]
MPKMNQFFFMLLFTGMGTSGLCQKLQWPFQVKTRIASTLIEGDSAAFFSEDPFQSKPAIFFAFSRPPLLVRHATLLTAYKKKLTQFFNAFLFQEDKAYSVNFFAFYIDSIKSPMRKERVYDYFERRRDQWLLHLSPDEKLQLLLNVQPYEAKGYYYGNDSVCVYMTLPGKSAVVLNKSYLYLLICSIYNFVTDDQLKKIVFYFYHPLGERRVFMLDDKFVLDYRRFIFEWASKLLHATTSER